MSKYDEMMKMVSEIESMLDEIGMDGFDFVWEFRDKLNDNSDEIYYHAKVAELKDSDDDSDRLMSFFYLSRYDMDEAREWFNDYLSNSDPTEIVKCYNDDSENGRCLQICFEEIIDYDDWYEANFDEED